MALSAGQVTQVFEILGVPQDGDAEFFSALAEHDGPAYDGVNLSVLVGKINAKLTALTAEQIVRVSALLSRHTAITSSSPMQLSAAGSARGKLADYPAEREAIRTALGNILGVAVPSGGLMAEAQRKRGGRICR
ncbi:MAG TPA: hypothetical protein VGP72_22180 [Planctomycetota bacterium]|jgi:hypothetical protein